VSFASGFERFGDRYDPPPRRRINGIYVDVEDLPDERDVEDACLMCHGRGSHEGETCPRCQGAGVES